MYIYIVVHYLNARVRLGLLVWILANVRFCSNDQQLNIWMSRKNRGDSATSTDDWTQFSLDLNLTRVWNMSWVIHYRKHPNRFYTRNDQSLISGYLRLFHSDPNFQLSNWWFQSNFLHPLSFLALSFGHLNASPEPLDLLKFYWALLVPYWNRS